MMQDTNKLELELLIKSFLASQKLVEMNTAFNYYNDKHDILFRKKYGIGEHGERIELKHVANYKIVDNKYRSILLQKVNYLLSKRPTITSSNEEYAELLNNYFNKNFFKLLLNLGKDVYKYGISWLYVYYDSDGKLSFKIFDSREIIPVWVDREHNELDKVIRIYTTNKFVGMEYKEIVNVEIYNKTGVSFGIWDNGIKSLSNEEPYFTIKGQPFLWKDHIPIIPFKANESESTLLSKCKSIQDSINELLSDFKNDMEDSSRNTILVIKKYGGNDGSLRRNINLYGYIDVEEDGGVDTISIEVNSENYKSILELLKNAMYENTKGIDAKSDRLGANPNQMNIQSMYSDIDLDANELEREFQTSLDKLLWFIDQDLLIFKKKNFIDDNVDIIFNRDIMINESQSIEDCVKSLGILSKESIIAQHPWTGDVKVELERLTREDAKKDELIGDLDSD